MEKILDREVAWRVFAWEFNRSNMHISEGVERAPNYIITPTGVKCNRLFIVGVVTEVENIGKDNTLWRGRVADPTGVFTVYAGQYQPESAIFLSELNIPAYVAVVGKARKFEPEDGSVYTSVRPEEINNADEKLRDRWVLDTAERTLERIMYIEDALSSGKSGNDLKNYLLGKGINAVLADGAAKAVEHYKNLDKTIAELKNAVIHAIKTVAPEMDNQPAGTQKEPQMKAHGVEKPQGFGVGASTSTVAPVDVVHTYGSAMDEIKTSSEIEEAVVEEEKEMTELKEPETGPKEIIAGIIDKLDTGKGIQYSTVVEAAQKNGIDPETLESGIKELMDEGRCYEPKIGVLRKV
ncbi:MAG: DNA-binding protein [Candidatus Methanoperedens sp.]|nr:DNA-binding protein [Candidatus Methanoperedens sp.]